LRNHVISSHEEECHQDDVNNEGDPRQDFSPAAGVEDTAAEQGQVEKNAAGVEDTAAEQGQVEKNVAWNL